MVDIPNAKPTEPKPEQQAPKPRAKKEIAKVELNATDPIDILLDKFGNATPDARKIAFLQIVSRHPADQWVKNTNPNAPDNKFLKNARGELIPYLTIARQLWLLDVLLLNPRWGEPKFVTERTPVSESIYVDQGGIQHRDVQTNECCIVTIPLTYYNHGYQQDITAWGTATVEMWRGNQKVELIHAKGVAMAKKSAIQSIGNLFGRTLDKSDDLEIRMDSSPFTREVAKNKLLEGIEQ